MKRLKRIEAAAYFAGMRIGAAGASMGIIARAKFRLLGFGCRKLCGKSGEFSTYYARPFWGSLRRGVIVSPSFGLGKEEHLSFLRFLEYNKENNTDYGRWAVIMKRRIGMIMIIILVAVAIGVGILAATRPEKREQETATRPEEKELTFPVATGKGGYTMETNGLYFTLEADGEYQFSHSIAKDGSREITLYTSSTELLLIEKTGDGSKYYQEAFPDSGVTYENPLNRIYDSLREQEFTLEEANGNTYHAQKSQQVEKENIVPYTCYTLSMTWKDEKTYVFQFFSGEDGGILVSVEAPDEINPYFTKDCKWRIDTEKLLLVHTQTGETIPLQLLNTTTGNAPSFLENSSKEYETKTTDIYVTTDEAGEISELRYVQDILSITVEILHDFTIERPAVSEDWEAMDAEAAESALMLMVMLEGMIG